MKRKKQVYRIAAVFGICLLALTGCKGKGTDAVARIQKSGELRVAVRTEGNPYIVLENESASGEEAEITEQIAAALGVKVQYLPVDTIDEAKEMLSAQEADIALGMISNQTDRGDSLELSNFYKEGHLYVLTRRGDYSDSSAAFKGRTLGVSAQIHDASLVGFQEVENLYTYQRDEEAVQALLDGVLDGYICHLERGLSLLSDERVQLQNIKGTDSERYVIVARKDDKNLLQGINTIVGRYLDERGKETSEEPEESEESESAQE